MKKLGDMLLSREPFSEIVMGNTALVRAMVEAGTRVVTSYPGSPTPEVAAAVASMPKEERPFYFEFSTNEKVATEVAFGASVNGHLSTVFFKSVGLNVASDTFVQLSLLNLKGGMVIVLGDDPGANSSQNEQDNRHYAKMAYVPVLEPADAGEVYTFYKEAARLSTLGGMPVILRLTTHVCHGKQKVNFDGWNRGYFDKTPRFDPLDGPYIPIAAALVPPLKRRALRNLSDTASYGNGAGINRIVDNSNKKRGVITMGLPFLSLMDVLEAARDKPDILKLGMVYPLPDELVADFLAEHEEVLVLEELDPNLEQAVKVLAFDRKIDVSVKGKMDDEDLIGEYTPGKVAEVLSKNWPGIVPARPSGPSQRPAVPERPAQMCPGCGHRSAFHAIGKVLAKEDITVADIGCHTLGFLPPYEMGQLLLCMGASTGIGSGMRLFNESRRVVVFMGDSTFFHAGLPGIVNAVFNNHPVTMILMENGTTAMTGHQDHAATGRNFNEVTEKIPVRGVLEGLGVQNIYEVDTYKQAELSELVKKALDHEGFSVVIAKHPCMLKFARKMRKKPGFKTSHVAVDGEKCGRLYQCIAKFACPSFRREKDGSITVNRELCIGDRSCVQTCSLSAIEPEK